MSLFFDANWFDARLAEIWLDRNALAACAGIDARELALRAGVAARAASENGETTSARIEDIEARLDAVDAWLEEFEASRKRA